MPQESYVLPEEDEFEPAAGPVLSARSTWARPAAARGTSGPPAKIQGSALTLMILQLNHLQRSPAADSAREVIDTLYGLLEEGHLEESDFARLRVGLDWIQYRRNFREPVTVVPGRNERGEYLPLMEVHADTRRVTSTSLREAVLRALRPESRDTSREADRVLLEDFRTFRSSIAWDFNRLYWRRLADWEQAAGPGCEQALPGDASDANHPAAVADSVADFWTLLRDLDTRNQLPPEIFVVEIGVGMGTRAAMWLDGFRKLDESRGTNYYPRLRFLLGDSSEASLERSKRAVEQHADRCSFIVLDALDPISTLSFLRHKVLHVHLTNVYGNLPDELAARRDGRLYLVQVRAYLPMADAVRIGAAAGVPVSEMGRTIGRLLEGGPESFADRLVGIAFWREVWEAMRLEERLVSFEELPEAEALLPAGLSLGHLEDLLRDAPSNFRFHLSSGALESFRNTLALLHPRGYLQVQDVFATDLNESRLRFQGPGKLEGSIVNRVNGVLLREVGERSGYDVHFASFHYRKDSPTSVLYTTQRE